MRQKPRSSGILFRHQLLGLLGVVAILVVSSVSGFLSGNARAAANTAVNFQARLMTGVGSIVPDGNYNVEFKLYDALTSSGSSQGSCTGDSHCLWTENYLVSGGAGQYVRVANGYLTVSLGSHTAFPGTINWSQQLWITMNIGGTAVSATWDGEMSPRLQLTAVPYAFAANTLATASGANTSSLVFTTPAAAGQVITLPNPASGTTATVCYQNDTSCGFASATTGSFIQNGTTVQTNANFNIRSAATGSVGAVIQGANGQTADLLQLQSYNGTISTNVFAVSKDGVVTLAGGQTLDVTTSGAATANSLVFQPGVSGANTTTGAAISVKGGDASGTTTVTAGAVTIQGGSATGASGTRNGGGVTVDGGTGATINGSINIGTANAPTINIGSVGSTVKGTAIHIGDTSSTTNAQAVTIGSAAANAGNITLIQGGNSNSATPAIQLIPASGGGIIVGATGGGGSLYFGRSTATYAITLASGVPAISATTTINIGNAVLSNSSSGIVVNVLSGGASTNGTAQLNLANNDHVTQVDIGNIASVSGVGRTLNVFTGNGAATDTINIGTGNTTVAGGKTIHIGDGTPSGSGTNLLTLGSTANASTTTIQGGTGSGAVSIQAGSSGTVSIGTSNANTVTIGSTNASTTVSITGGSAVNVGTVGTGTAASAIHIADTSDATGTQAVTIGSVAKGANSTSIQGGTTGGINVGTVGSATTGSTVHIADTTSATSAQAVTVGSIAANSSNNTTIQGGTGAGAVSIQAATSGTVSVGTSNANTLSIGNTTAATTTTIQGGTNATAAVSVQAAGGGVIAIGNTNNNVIKIGTLTTSTNAAVALCRDSTNGNIISCSTSTGTGTPFVQGGNAFGAPAVLGTTDANNLQIITGASGPNVRATFDQSNNLYLGNGTSAGTPTTTFSILGTTSTTSGTAGTGISIQAGTSLGAVAGGLLQLLGGNAAATGTNGGVTIDTGSGATTANGTINLGSTNAANINVGINGAGGAVTQNINIGANSNAGATNAVTIGNSSATASTVTVNGGTGASAIVLQSGSGGTISIGSNAVSKTVNIGSTGSVAGASTVNIASTSANNTQAVAIGSNGATGNTIDIDAGTGASGIEIGNTNTAHGIQIGSNATGDNDILLGGANAGSTTNIEGGTAATAIQVGNGNTSHGIQVGTGTGTQTVVVGSLSGVSATTIQAGTGNLRLQTSAAAASIIAQSGVNGTTAFAIQNAAFSSLFNVDTTDANLVVNPGAETAFSTDWTGYQTGGSVTRTTTAGQFYNGVAGVSVTTGTSNTAGGKNSIGVALTNGTQYVLSFWAKLNSGTMTDLQVGISKDGTTGTEQQCGSNFTLSTTAWTHYSCVVTPNASGNTSAYVFFRQANTGVSRTFFVDNVGLTASTNTTTPSIKVGGQGATTVLTLDQAAGAPIATGQGAYLGSIYYNTTSGHVQCYEDNGVGGSWGDCGNTTLQQGYTNSATGSTPEIILDSTRTGIDIQDKTGGSIGATQGLLNVRGVATATTLGASLFTVNGSGQVGINNGSTSVTPSINYDLSFGQIAGAATARTIGVETQTSPNIGGNGLTITGGTANGTGTGGQAKLQGGTGGSGAAALGGDVLIQGGAANGTGASNGGNVTIQGGTLAASGVKGLIQLNGGTYFTTGTYSTGSTSSIPQATVDSFSAILVSATAGSLTITVPSPSNGAGQAGRIMYITNNGANAFILSASTSLSLSPGATATLVWTGTAWTNAGADAATLQNDYTNSIGTTTPEIILDVTRAGLDIQDANGGYTGTNDQLLSVRTGASSGKGNPLLTITNSGGNSGTPLVGIGVETASRALHVNVNNSTVNALPVLVQQTGTGDTGIELKTATANNNFYVDVDASSGNAFTINSYTAATATSTTSTFGQLAGANPDSNGNFVQISNFTATLTGNINSMTVDFGTAGTTPTTPNTFTVAVYADNGSGTFPAGTPIGYSSLQSISAPNALGHNSNVIVTSPIPVTNGTTYWLAFNTSGNAQFASTGGQPAGSKCQYYSGVTNGTWANVSTWGAPTLNSSTCSFNIQATVTQSTSFTDSNANALFTLGQSGQTIFKNSSNSTAAFVIQNATATSTALSADTTNNRVGIALNAGEVSSFDLSLGGGANRTIGINQAPVSGNGANLTLQAGQANTTGTGGQLNLQGGAAAGTNQVGGAVAVTGGQGTGTQAGGAITLNGGIGGATGAGGAITITGGTGGATSGAGGNVTLQGGTAKGATAGGTATLQGGTAAATAGSNGGGVAITGAVGSSTGTGGTGGNITLTAGNSGGSGNNAGGSIVARLGAATGTGTQGTFQVQNALGASLLTVDPSNTAASLNLATNGGVETGGSPPTGWSAHGGAAAPTQTTTAGQFISGTAAVAQATTASGHGVRNALSSTALADSTTYVVSFSIKVSVALTNANTVVEYYRNNTPTLDATCSSFTQATISINNFVKYSCTFTTSSSGTAKASTNFLAIRQADGTARTLYIDNLSVVAQNAAGTQNTGTLRVGGASSQGLTLFTLDTYAGNPFSGANSSLAGSMYFDTTQSKIQCYDGTSWGACGAAPNGIVTLTPEYTGAVLNGTGIGTMTSDFCANSGALTVGTLCAANDARNFYKWTSPQGSAQPYSIYVTYKLPPTFKAFVAGTTSMTGLVDNTTNASVKYAIFKSTGAAISSCSALSTIVGAGVGSANTWTPGVAGTLSGTTDPSTCGFAAGNNVIFQITVSANSNAASYAENLNFQYSNQ